METKLSRVAVVVPTVRPETLAVFLDKWRELFNRHQVLLVIVHDGERPRIESTAGPISPDGLAHWRVNYPEDIHPKHAEFLFHRTDAVRNIGFLAAMKRWPDTQVILTLDDDVFPEPGMDPIADHLAALEMRVPISWFSTASEYMRGFPYGVRTEAEVMVSHGVWSGVHDYDGPTQLVNGVKPATFYCGPVPKGCHTPVCGMNLAFKVAVLPWVYFAPMGKALGFQRFADIWMGLRLKHCLDLHGLAMVSGCSRVFHSRASNVLTNLQEEAAGIVLNETLWSNLWPTDQDKNVLDKHPYVQQWQRACAAWIDATVDLIPSEFVNQLEAAAGPIKR